MEGAITAAEVDAAIRSQAPKTLRMVLRMMACALVVWALGALTVYENKVLASELIAAVAVTTVVAWWLLRAGKPVWASVTLLGSWWVAVVVVVLLSGGIRSPGLDMLLMPVIVAALVLGKRGLIASVVLVTAFCTVLLLLYEYGVELPLLFPGPPPALWLDHCVTLIMLAFVVREAVYGLGGAIAMARREVEARGQVERSLRESEARLSAVIANAPSVAVQWYERDGTVLLWNQASERVFGYSSAEAVGKKLDDLIHTDEQAKAFVELLSTIASSGEPFGPEEFNFVRKNGEKGTCLSTVFGIPGRGDGKWFVCMDIDVTELKRAEEQVRQSQKLQAIGQLAGGIAHDFNNMLTVVNGYGEVLSGRLPAGDAVARSALDAIREAGQRAGMLTRQLLAFSRRQIIEPRIIDIDREIREIELLLRRLVGERVELELATGGGGAAIKIDPSQFQQVLMNLAVNARDAMPTGGRLRIETFCTGERGGREERRVCLRVQDWGVGMSGEVKGRIFEPFFTTKGPGKGTGLGLSSVYGIVQQSGGLISVESAEGAGSTFTVCWPPADEPVSSAHDSARPSDANALRGSETLLLVEDEEIVRNLIASTLTERGYRVLPAANGAQALEQANQHREAIRIVVTDLMMPGMNGRELSDRLREVIPGLRVLFMSGYADDVTFRDGVPTQEQAFIQKPFTPAEIEQKIRKVLEESPAGAK